MTEHAGAAGPPEGRPLTCSAKRCSRPAVWLLVWNNPRLHTPDREKTWTACDEHRETLSHHLAIRSFLRRVEPLVPPTS